MNHSQAVLNVVVDQNSSDNNTRKNAELQFNNMSSQDPTSVVYVLIQSSLNEELPIDIKQSCLLHLKRLVPKYWSMGFQSFVGPPINQELKQLVRQNLIQVATSSPSSKLRAGSSYCIIQIAASDYPDEWPDLLNQLYMSTTNYEDRTAMLGGLTVLNDLFDDLITEEQFWEGGIGTELTSHIVKLLEHGSIDTDIKTNCIKLYQSILNTLQSPEAFSNSQRKDAVYQHISSMITMFVSLLADSTTNSISNTDKDIRLSDLYFRSYIYKILNSFLGNFNKRIELGIKQSILSIMLKDFTFSSSCFKSWVILEDNDLKAVTTTDLLDPAAVISSLVIELLQTLSVLQNNISISTEMNALHQFIEDVIQCSILPQEAIQIYENDFNTYVTDITGLSSSITVRDAINELLSELNDQDAGLVFSFVMRAIENSDGIKWQLKECYLYLIESLFMNEESESIGENIKITELLNSLTKFISYEVSPMNHPLVSSRCFLLLPKVFEKLESRLSVDSFAAKAFIEMINFVKNYKGDDDDLFSLVKVNILVSCTFYKQLLNLKKSLSFTSKQEIQMTIFQIIFSLTEESEEDGLPALLEAIAVAIDIDNVHASKAEISNGTNVVDLIFKISFKDAANLQLTVDSSECVKVLLDDISAQDYLTICEKSLPFILHIIQTTISSESVDYTSELDLALEILSIIIDSAPAENNEFPKDVFNYTFPVLNKLILLSTDDQILQSAGQVFNNILEKASKLFIDYVDPESKKSGIDMLLTIVSKFLSPELSDSAAMNCGSIVSSLIDKFQPYLSHDFLSQILEATVRRLLRAQEVVTIENLIMVFCNLVLSSPQDMINFLCDNVKLQDPNTGEVKSGLALVLPIWFQSFEITRGYEKIKQNTLSLGKIFTLNAEPVHSLLVDGDIIPYQGDLIRTRSMTKQMPDQYTQISASQKILKLLISELNFQCQQPNANDYLPDIGEESEDGDDDGWEDMSDIGVPNYDKLKSYVGSDNEDQDTQKDDDDDDLRNILIHFFKECTAKNLGDFQKYYNLLDDDEKKILTENLVF